MAGPIKRLKERPPGHRKALAPKVGLNWVPHPAKSSFPRSPTSQFISNPAVPNPRSPSTHLRRHRQEAQPICPSPRTSHKQNDHIREPFETPQGYFRSPIAPTIPVARSSPLTTITALSQNSLFTRPSLATNTPPKTDKAEHGCKPGACLSNSLAFSIVEVGLGLDAHDGSRLGRVPPGHSARAG